MLDAGRLAVVGSLTAVVVLAWGYVLHGAGMGSAGAPDLHAPLGMAHHAWTPTHFAMMVTMWIVMMVAMMMPSALPMLLLVDRLNRARELPVPPAVATLMFAAGYIAVWLGFSVLATGAQWGLEHSGVLASSTFATTSETLAGWLFIAAGAYQLTPLKRTCLEACRSPLDFLSRHWRSGLVGKFRMGLQHGVLCVGCCWVLMCLLFVSGVMNLLWISVLAIYVLVEKCAPGGAQLGRAAGIGLVLWGAAVLTW